MHVYTDGSPSKAIQMLFRVIAQRTQSSEMMSPIIMVT